MSEYYDDENDESVLEVENEDPVLETARERLAEFFDQNRDGVFYSRQLEVRFEREFFHWITNRAIRDLVDDDELMIERHELEAEGVVDVLWHPKCRYYRRASKNLVDLVNEYSDPVIGAALGLQGEAMVLEGFASQGFLMRGRETKSHGGRDWQETGHDLDFIFERDGVAYGVEVKNTLGYMEYEELTAKVAMCQYLGLRPIMACGMLPRTWAWEDVIEEGGYAMILGYQLYPWGYRDLARRVREELGLPVDSPRRLADGTMLKFMKWHRRNV